MHFKTFLQGHADSVNSIANILEALLHFVPINQSEKSHLVNAVEGIRQSANAVAAAANDMSNVTVIESIGLTTLAAATTGEDQPQAVK